MTNEIVRGDAANTHESVSGADLTVTSPPYLQSVDYGEYKNGGDYKGSSKAGDADPPRYRGWMREVAGSLLEATTGGGYAAVVSGTVKVGDAEWVPTSHLVSSGFIEAGWTLHEHIVWNKVAGGTSRFGTTIQHPYPGYYYPNQMHEQVLVFRKGAVEHHRGERSRLDVDCDVVVGDCGQNVWHIPPVPPNAGVDHPAPFPEKLAYRLIKFYSPHGGLVLDPFCGSGTTPKVARRAGRDWWACDTDGDFVETAKNRLREGGLNRAGIVPEYQPVDPEGP